MGHVIYLDNNSTTPVRKEVMRYFMEETEGLFGNASASHSVGQASHFAIEESRENSKILLGCPKLIFVSSASEGNNLVIRARVSMFKNAHVLMSAIEHPSVYNTVFALHAEKLCTYDVIPVDKQGRIKIHKVDGLIRRETVVVCVIRSNNETGVIQDDKAIAQICRRRGVHFHVDATQCVGKIPYRFNSDSAVISPHKFGGLKGVAAVLLKQSDSVKPLCTGGKQEFGLRAGTESAPLIRSFGRSLEMAVTDTDNMSRIGRLRDKVERFLVSKKCIINSALAPRLPNTVSATLPVGFEGKTIMKDLDRRDICVSMGSACAKGGPSGTLRAMGLNEKQEARTLRVSLGYQTTDSEIDAFIWHMSQIFEHR